VYHVHTTWTLNYPAQLREQMHNKGFEIVTDPLPCGWQSITGISRLRVARGKIDVSHTEGQPWGHPEEIRRVEEVMVREYPFVEILVLCATLVGPFVSFFGLLGWWIWAERTRPKP